MRGKAKTNLGYFDEVRITPAYAGKRLEEWQKEEPLEDHPRLCGEKVPVLLQAAIQLGSPPPMRGKGTVEDLLNVIDGITPAYAGKSCEADFKHKLIKDHPRLCGEK